MIAFASLFLGLIVGPEPVELLVDEAVARVEIRLDDRLVGELSGEPWSIVCDFGEALEPHELIAVAYDHGRRELGRARQWVNLPRSPAEASLMLEGGERGRGVTARLSWQSVVATEPVSIEVSFDGRPLTVKDPRRIPLPAHDPEQLHFFRAELDFSANVTTVLETVFGGSYGDRLNVQLTAVPLVLERGAELPDLSQLRGRLHTEGRALRVVAAEEGPAEIVVVRDEAIRPILDRIGRTSDKTLRQRARVGFKSQAARSLRFRMALPKDHLIRFVWPFSQRQPQARPAFDVLIPSQAFTAQDGGLYWLLTEFSPPAGVGPDPRLADAVAVAGLLAAGRNRRRAVVLVTGRAVDDTSLFRPEAVRHYLESLRVPLFVWSPEPETQPASRTRRSPWGPVTDISSLNKLEQAVRELVQRLDRHRIVWVEGVHAPAAVTLAGAEDGMRLAP
ncbi:MAG: hypothetical protein AAF657_23075 [Acidobacteriota bacterium]